MCVCVCVRPAFVSVGTIGRIMIPIHRNGYAIDACRILWQVTFNAVGYWVIKNAKTDGRYRDQN